MSGAKSARKRLWAPQVSPSMPKPKKAKTFDVEDRRCYRLRSGLVVTHPLVNETATMEVESLSQFELASPTPSSQRSSGSLSQSRGRLSPTEYDSDGSIIAVWSPQHATPRSTADFSEDGAAPGGALAASWGARPSACTLGYDRNRRTAPEAAQTNAYKRQTKLGKAPCLQEMLHRRLTCTDS
jgi:hypothetical protein